MMNCDNEYCNTGIYTNINKVLDIYGIYDIDSFIRPERFGVIGDGTVDDTISIQNALNTKMPVLLSKKYRVSDTLHLHGDMVLLKNASIYMYANKPVIDLTEYGSRIDGNGSIIIKTKDYTSSIIVVSSDNVKYEYTIGFINVYGYYSRYINNYTGTGVEIAYKSNDRFNIKYNYNINYIGRGINVKLF